MINKYATGIAVAGSITVDKTPDLVHSGRRKLLCTGCVPNLALMLKKMSPEMPINALGRVGDDAEGRYVVQRLQSAGIDASGIRAVSGEVTGSRQGMLHAGAPQSFGVCDVEFRKLSCRILHLGYFLMMDRIDNGDGRNILKHARRCGMETSLSMLSGVSDRYAAVLAALPYVDYFTVSIEDAAWLVKMDPVTDGVEKIARRLLWYGVKKKVFIYSTQWIACCSKTRYSEVGNYILPENCTCSDEQLCDGFTAGILEGISNRWSDMKILETASACAAFQMCQKEPESLEKILDHCKQFQRRKKVL